METSEKEIKTVGKKNEMERKKADKDRKSKVKIVKK